MSAFDLDGHLLRQGLLKPVLFLLVCLAVWGATAVYRSRTAATLAAGEATLASLVADRDALVERREARRQFAQVYQQLSVRGVVGIEQRLAWIQATRDAGRELKLPYLRYTTTPQRPFEAPWLTPGIAAPVLVSHMDLQLGLVHEVDLLRLLARLQDAPGLLQMPSCNLDRLATAAIPEPGKANITGSCQLALYSMPREPTLAAAHPES